MLKLSFGANTCRYVCIIHQVIDNAFPQNHPRQIIIIFCVFVYVSTCVFWIVLLFMSVICCLSRNKKIKIIIIHRRHSLPSRSVRSMVCQGSSYVGKRTWLSLIPANRLSRMLVCSCTVLLEDDGLTHQRSNESLRICSHRTANHARA